MDAALWSSLSALLGAVVGGGISYLLNRQQLANQLRIQQETHKVEFMAETTARHFLQHKSFTDRSFETLRNHLGGFTDDEVAAAVAAGWAAVSLGPRVLRVETAAVTAAALLGHRAALTPVAPG